MEGKQIPLSVEEACAGVRLLMAFVALSVAMAYMTARPVWQRVVLVLMGIPVAIAANVLRVAGTCAFFVWGYDEFGKDLMHDFAGLLTLIPAAVMLWLLAKLMDAMFVEVDDEDDDAEDVVEAEVESAS
jgi:exosortase/archaeosortase family protein